MRPVAIAMLASLACSSAREPPVHRDPGSTVAPPAPTDSSAAPDATAARYETVLRTADWVRWPGLPPDLREAELRRDLGLDASGTRRDGRLSGHDVVIVETADLRYWLRDDRVVLLELTKRLGPTPSDDLRARLGTADRDAAGRFLQSGSTTTEYVYASRGLAFTVAASYDQPPKFAPHVIAIQLFAATDLRGFVLELGGNDRGGPAR